MSISQAILPHIPYLRRYARALSGTQQSGDAYVIQVLEVLREDPTLYDHAEDSRVAIYRIFSKVWNSVAVNGIGSGGAERVAPGSAVDSITPRPRQAFLLTTVENFSDAEAARILGTSVEDVRVLVETAGREIAEQVATDVLVIEDEPIIAMDLEALVEGLGHRVLGTARTQTEAVELARRRRPGLILADIQLADGSSGIDAVNEIIQEFDVPVIFITAYPERLLTGARPEPAFLITKPFQSDMVRAVVSQALFFDTRARGQRRAVA